MRITGYLDDAPRFVAFNDKPFQTFPNLFKPFNTFLSLFKPQPAEDLNCKLKKQPKQVVQKLPLYTLELQNKSN